MTNFLRRWGLLLAGLVVLVFIAQALDSKDSEPRELHTGVQLAEESPGLRIVEYKPTRTTAGSAVVVQVSGLNETEERELSASVAGEPAQILHASGGRLVVRLPPTLPDGRAEMRVMALRGGESESTQPVFVEIGPISRRKVLRNVLGGLALFVLGLQFISRSMRQRAGHGPRQLLEPLAKRPSAAFGLGMLVGGLTQSITTTTALLLGLLRARLLPVIAAAGVLVGAQLGAALTISFLPVTAIREALLLVGLGLAWQGISRTRRQAAIGGALLGLGLLFYGLRVMRQGFQPLVADPEVLPLLESLAGGGVGGLLTATLVGAVLALLLQGPAPVFALVLGLAEATGLLGMDTALAILAGSCVGTAATSLPLGAAFGTRGIRLGLAHALLGLSMTVVVLVGLPLWTELADRIVGGDPMEIDYGKKVLLPRFGAHLAAAFAVSSIAAAAGAALLLRPTLALVKRLTHRASKLAEPPPAVLADVAARCAEGLERVRGVVESVDRVGVEQAETTLRDARHDLERIIDAPGSSSVRSTALSLGQLIAAIEGALRLAERGAERDLRPGNSSEAVARLDELTRAGLSDVIAALRAGEEIQLADAQALEIRINGAEAEARSAQARDENGDDARTRLFMGELLAAYEGIGNHLYRVAVTLSDPDWD